MKTKSLFFVFILALTILVPVRVLAESNPGGRYVVSNPGFEADNQDPWSWWGEAGTGTYGASEYAHTGKKSVKIVADKGDYVPMGLLQDFECEPEEKVTASAWVMSPADSPLTDSNAFIKLEFWKDDYTIIEAYESEHLTGAFDWTEVAVSGKAPEETTKVKIGLFIWNPGTEHSGIVYFDDAKMSEGAPFLF